MFGIKLDVQKLFFSEVKRRKDYKFIYKFFLQNSNLSKREKIAYIYNSWNTFFDDVLKTNLKIRRIIINYILEGMVEKEDRFGRMIRYLKKNDFLNKKDVQKVLVGKLNFSNLYIQKFYLLVKESPQVYLFSDLNIFLVKPKILKILIKKGWYERNYKNFELIVHVKLRNKEEKFNIPPSYVKKYIIPYFNEHKLSEEKYRKIRKILY